jgi:hypothetical protein
MPAVKSDQPLEPMTGKEFDKDIRMICSEAKRLGLDLVSDKIIDMDY